MSLRIMNVAYMMLMLVGIIDLSKLEAIAQSGRFDTTYLVDDAMVTWVARPGPMLAHVSDDELMAEFFNDMQAEAGLDVDKIRQLSFQSLVPGGEGVDFDANELFFMVFHYDGEIDQELILDNGPGFESIEHEGQEIFSALSGFDPSFCFPNESTFMVGHVDHLKRVLDQPQSMGSVQAKLRQYDEETEMAFIVDMESMPDFVKEEMLSGIPELGDFDPVDLAETLRLIEFEFNFDSDRPIAGVMEAGSAEAAENLSLALGAAVDLGRLGLPMAREQVMHSSPEYVRGEIKSIFKSVNAALAGFTAEASDQNVVIEVNVEGGIAEMLKITSLLFLGFDGPVPADDFELDRRADRGEEFDSVVEALNEPPANVGGNND